MEIWFVVMCIVLTLVLGLVLGLAGKKSVPATPPPPPPAPAPAPASAPDPAAVEDPSVMEIRLINMEASEAARRLHVALAQRSLIKLETRAAEVERENSTKRAGS
jgi:hypothetical protein